MTLTFKCYQAEQIELFLYYTKFYNDLVFSWKQCENINQRSFAFG